MSGDIILVAGLGRCGTSLMLQMLGAGGVPCVGTYPDFEDHEHDQLRRTDPTAWVRRAAGLAVKLLDPHRFPPPLGPRYRTIWLFRDWDAQARSQLKLAGATVTRGARKRMARCLRADTGRAGDALRMAGAGGAADWLVVPFDCLLLGPLEMAARVAAFLDRPLDMDAMAACAVDRPPGCLPYLLEPHLVARAAA